MGTSFFYEKINLWNNILIIGKMIFVSLALISKEIALKKTANLL